MRISAWLLVAACGGPAPETEVEQDPVEESPPIQGQDLDHDGAMASEDCDDEDPDRFPGADERCDGVDNDCDGFVDEDPIDGIPAYEDLDGDGVGGGAPLMVACDVSPALVTVSGDCDDTDPAIGPNAEEACDGIDTDCDPSTTEDGLITIGDRTFDDLQAAVDTAVDGDVVTVCDGTYTGSVRLPAVDLVIQSMNGAASTVLDAAGLGPALVTQDGGLTLVGLTITGGTPSPDTDHGGGVSATRVSLTVVDSVFDGNRHGYGGAIGLTDGVLVVSGTEFLSNTASTQSGGAVYSHGSSVSFDQCTFTDNRAANAGGGLVASGDGTVTITDSTFTGNGAARSGAAYIDAGSFSITDSTFVDNRATADAGALDISGTGTIADTTFDGNSAATGGAIKMLFVTLRLERVELLDNRAADNGGALYPWSSCTVEIVDSLVQGNTAGTGGGAMYWYNPATIHSLGTDWGSGPNDNAPTDFRYGFSDFDAPAGDFDCSGGGVCN